MNTGNENELLKIGFKLDCDKEEYPLADWEWMWAKPIGEAKFRIDNVPFLERAGRSVGGREGKSKGPSSGRALREVKFIKESSGEQGGRMQRGNEVIALEV